MSDVIIIEVPIVEVLTVQQVTEVVTVATGQPGPPGATGPAGVGAAFRYNQAIASAEWIIPVPAEFTYQPSVTVYSDSGEQVDTDVHYSTEFITITFPSPATGSATIN